MRRMEFLARRILCTLLGVLLPPASAFMAEQSVTDKLYHVCNPNNFSSNDSFARNFNSVATSLTYNSSHFLYSLASSVTGSELTHVYGIYQCRGDISLSDCSSCVIFGLAQFSNTSSALSLCGMLAGGARVRYTGCYLRSSFPTKLESKIVKIMKIRPSAPALVMSPPRSTSRTCVLRSRTAPLLHPSMHFLATAPPVWDRAPIQPMHSPNAWATLTLRSAPHASLSWCPISAVFVTDPFPVRSTYTLVTTSSATPPSFSLITAPPLYSPPP